MDHRLLAFGFLLGTLVSWCSAFKVHKHHFVPWSKLFNARSGFIKADEQGGAPPKSDQAPLPQPGLNSTSVPVTLGWSTLLLNWCLPLWLFFFGGNITHLLGTRTNFSCILTQLLRPRASTPCRTPKALAEALKWLGPQNHGCVLKRVSSPKNGGCSRWLSLSEATPPKNDSRQKQI